MRIDHIVNVFATKDTAATRKLFGQKETDPSLSRLDGMQTIASGILRIAASGTESIPLGDVTVVRGVSFEADQNFNAAFNGLAAIPFRLADAEEGRKVKFLMEALLASISIINQSSTLVLEGTYCVWGDPLP